jgi:para-aminobenzoate synthetase
VRTLLVDNHDSYTYNLFHLLAEVNGEEPLVVRNDELAWIDAARLGADNIVISPGPGRPSRSRDLGISADALLYADVPVLGVCLGHQALAHLSGGGIGPVTDLVHGRVSRIIHDGRALFAGLPPAFRAVRYHSLRVTAVPPSLRVVACTGDGLVMGLEHRSRPAWGVQFHPESICTEHGAALIENFRAMTVALRGGVPPRRRRLAPPRRARAAPRLAVHHRIADAWTEPEDVFCAMFAARRSVAWLDSAHTGGGLARFSFIGVPDGPLGHVVRYRAADGALTVEGPGGPETRCEPVLEHLERRLRDLRADAPELPFDFVGGFAGYLGYEVRGDCGAPTTRSGVLPDAAMLFCDRVVAFDHLEQRVHLVALADEDGAIAARTWLDAAERRIARVEPAPAVSADVLASMRFEPADDRGAYIAKVRACQEEIRAGESYEICLTTELASDDPLADPVAAYRALRARNPAPHAALLRLDEISVLSSSPERFLRVDRRRVAESKPIKGTAPRSDDPWADAGAAVRLRMEEKTRAENLMIADLVRNDLGRVSVPGSVEVPDLMAVESYATVHQLVTRVRGRLRDDATAIDCVRAAFPPGSMTGAPKRRTMDIIDRLEARPRGPYAGALGYLSVNGTVDLGVVIRTLVSSPAGSRVGAGGAVVAGSDPGAEHDEMLLKARAVLGMNPTPTARSAVAGPAAASVAP